MHSQQLFHSYVVDCQELGVSCYNVVDFEWLSGYSDPTILLLHQHHPMWSV